MNNVASKRMIITWLSILCIAIAFLVGKFIYSAATTSNANETQQVVSVGDEDENIEYSEIGTAQALASLMKSYDLNYAQYQNANIRITADIDNGLFPHAFVGNGFGLKVNMVSSLRL